MRSEARLLQLALAVAVGSGCAKERSISHDVVERDSAGIRLVTNSRPQRTTVLDGPTFEIGSRSANPVIEFGGIGDVIVLGDGTIVVVDGLSQSVHFFSATGKPISSMGRAGSGPGEFLGTASASLYRADTIAVYDSRLGRISLLRAPGVLTRTVQFHPGTGYHFVGVASDSILLFFGDQRPPRPDPGFYWDSSAVIAFTPGSSRVDTVANLPSYHRVGGAGEYSRPYFLAPRASLAALHGGFCTSRGDRPWVDCFDIAGRRTLSFSWQAPTTQVTEITRTAWLQGYERNQLRQAGVRVEEMRAFLRERFTVAAWPDSLPHSGQIQISDGGDIWVQRYQTALGEDPTEWFVFDTSGRWITVVQLPARFSLRRIAEPLLLGTWRDEDDVESVRGYRLR